MCTLLGIKWVNEPVFVWLSARCMGENITARLVYLL